MSDEIYVSVTEAAQRLGVHRKAVLRWCAAGQLGGAMKLPGGGWRIPARALEQPQPQSGPAVPSSYAATHAQQEGEALAWALDELVKLARWMWDRRGRLQRRHHVPVRPWEQVPKLSARLKLASFRPGPGGLPNRTPAVEAPQAAQIPPCPLCGKPVGSNDTCGNCLNVRAAALAELDGSEGVTETAAGVPTCPICLGPLGGNARCWNCFQSQSGA